MKTIKTWLATITMLLCSVIASAYDFEVDGIYYKIISETDSTVMVSGDPDSDYRGAIIIPETVEYNNKTYRVTAIGAEAFENCYSLTSITIPKSVTSVGEEAFDRCTQLSRVVFEDGDEGLSLESSYYYGLQYRFQRGLFQHCALTEVYVGRNLTGYCIFKDQASLAAVTISDCVTNISGGAFLGTAWYDNLAEGIMYIGKTLYSYKGEMPANTSIEIMEGTIEVADYAFSDQKNLISITIPESVTKIGVYAFKGCSNLNSFIIADGNLNYDVRNNCNAIIETNTNTLIRGCGRTIIPEGVISIGEYAFSDCSDLTYIKIPESVLSIEDGAFDNCLALKEVIFEDGDKDLSLGCNKHGVNSSVGEGLFYDCPIESVRLGRNFSYSSSSFEGYSPFYSKANLSSVVIGESVTNISDYAFYGCSSLISISIPEGMTTISDYAFYDCSNLTSIIIPESVTYIGNKAFYGCWNIKTVINYSDLEIQNYSDNNGCLGYYADRIVNADKIIDGYAFKIINDVHYLICYIGDDTELTLPETYQNGNYQIGSYAFKDCRDLTSVIIPKGVTSIGERAFYDCSSLKTVINYSDLTIQKGSYEHGCVGYYADKVANVDEFIDDYAFRTIDGVHYLTSYMGDDTELTLPNNYQGKNYQIGDYAFDGCSSLTSITIPESVQLTSIGNYAFRDCSNLTAITIPNSATSIGNCAFNNCTSLKELTLGKGLRKITSGAFYGCEELEKITIHTAQPPTTTGNIFTDKVYENATLYVPQGCISKYQVMTGWSGFYNISEIEGGTPDYLTIKQADNGAVKIAVDLGRTYKVQIEPSDGWKVHSVTFNGVDIMAQLADDNIFTTPTLTGSSVLNVAYEQVSNEVEAVRSQSVKVRGYEGVIYVNGAELGDHIAIYTANGNAVAEVIAEGTNTEIPVVEGLLYIVKVADKVIKIQM